MKEINMSDVSEEAQESNKYVHDYWKSNGKEDINKLLWTLLPGETTLKQADDIAVKIYMMIDELWEETI